MVKRGEAGILALAFTRCAECTGNLNLKPRSFMASVTPDPETKPVRSGYFPLRPILVAGVTASLVFQLLEMILIPLSGGGSPWGPVRMIAAMVLGPKVLPPPVTFDLFIVAVAFLIDIVLSIVYTAALGLLIRRLRVGAAMMLAACFGAALYWVNFHGFTEWFPWFEMGRNSVTVFTHIIFSATAAWVYKSVQLSPTDNPASA
jgi:hypothetical protein